MAVIEVKLTTPASELVHGASAMLEGRVIGMKQTLPALGSGDTIDGAAFVVANIESAFRALDDVDRTAVNGAGGLVQPACCEVFKRSGRYFAIEGQTHNFVAGRFAAIPGAMEGDEEVVAILGWKGVTGVEFQA